VVQADGVPVRWCLLILGEGTDSQSRLSGQVSPSTADVLGDVVRLYALKRIEGELSWLIGEELLPAGAGKTVPTLVR